MKRSHHNTADESNTLLTDWSDKKEILWIGGHISALFRKLNENHLKTSLQYVHWEHFCNFKEFPPQLLLTSINLKHPVLSKHF